MSEILRCSNCFKDNGLRLDAFKIGIEKALACPNCGAENGKKLNIELIEELAYRFFVRGSVQKSLYGSSPILQFNEAHYQQTNIKVSDALKADIQLIEEALKIGFFYYGPRLWMLGETEPLKALQSESERHSIIEHILSEYPVQIFHKNEIFYRLRINPEIPSNHSEYDSPLIKERNNGRLDSMALFVMYVDYRIWKFAFMSVGQRLTRNYI